MRGIVLECRQRGQGAQCPRVDALVQLVHGAHNEIRGLLPGLEHDVEYKQLPLSSRLNLLPVKRINWTLLMGHEYLARALVELMQIGKIPSRSNAVLHHPPEAFDGVEVVPTMGR